jgi:hypothetical protein
MYKDSVERVGGVQESKEERMNRVNGRVERFCTKVSCKKWRREEGEEGRKKRKCVLRYSPGNVQPGACLI